MKNKNKEQTLCPFGTSPLTGRFNSGFTLFELLVSISIIAILTALASVSFSVAQKKARDSRRMEDMKMIQSAAEQYYSLNTYAYPLTYTAGTKWTAPGGQVVLESVPSDPKNTAPYVYACGAGGCDATKYCYCAQVENTGAANSDNNCDFGAVAKTHFCVKNQQ